MAVGLSAPDRAPGPLANPGPGIAATVGLPRNRLLQGRLQELPYTKGIPVDNLLFALISLAMRWLGPRHNAQFEFLREQIRMLRA